MSSPTPIIRAASAMLKTQGQTPSSGSMSSMSRTALKRMRS
ncbi:MAG: hypothetical protein NTW19_10830 [Planctomycetota bacterium]|nr:hypothetical protein [Planctomycetota bacterium]